jgi:hypothetical protein
VGIRSRVAASESTSGRVRSGVAPSESTLRVSSRIATASAAAAQVKEASADLRRIFSAEPARPVVSGQTLEEESASHAGSEAEESGAEAAAALASAEPEEPGLGGRVGSAGRSDRVGGLDDLDVLS